MTGCASVTNSRRGYLRNTVFSLAGSAPPGSQLGFVDPFESEWKVHQKED